MSDDTNPRGAHGDLEHQSDTPDQPLACGASVGDLLEQVAEGHANDLDDHQSHCAHCRAALIELADVWQPVRDLAAEPVRVPHHLVSAVMAQINRLVRDVWYTLQVGEIGVVRVAARVIARLARDAAQAVPGVTVALGRSTDHRLTRLVERATGRHQHPNAAVGVLGRTAVVDLAVSVEYGLPVHEVAERVQQAAMRKLQDSVALTSVTVNVTVDDVQPRGPGSSKDQ